MTMQSLLQQINSPEDVKALRRDQLPQLCTEIRELLIETISKNGGHLASNLGVVELTVAIHRIFSSPKDKVVFDVGHQCYTHKILTGRREAFSTIRQEGGLSGFPRPQESEHDAFIAGHSSTSVSAGFGISQAKALQGDDGYVVVVIGDGALTGGLAYEALNNAGRSHDRLIVILNDNKMSISPNVGAMSRYLTKIRTRPNYHRFKSKTERFLLKIPRIGKKLRDWAFRSKTSIKSLFYDSTIFENMGFAYLGPIDGHDFEKLDDVFSIAKQMRRPALIHVNTVKGKGYCHAEKDPKRYHGISQFDAETGDYTTSKDSYSYAFGDYAATLAAQDKRICAITAAMGEGTGLLQFRQLYKERFFDVGIAEEHAVTFACGLSITGLIPIFAVYSSFLQRSYDQLIHDAAAQELKLVLAIDRAGIVGDDGETHQGVFDVAFLNSIPHVTVYSPSTYGELRTCLYHALYDDKGVCAVRYPRGASPALPDDFTEQDVPYAVYGDVGAEVGLITYGRLFICAIEARRTLLEQGIGVKIIKLNRIKPIDAAALQEALQCRLLFFFEEGMKNGGVGQVFAQQLLEQGYRGRYHLTAIDNCFVPQAKVERSLHLLGLDAEEMARQIAAAMKENEDAGEQA